MMADPRWRHPLSLTVCQVLVILALVGGSIGAAFFIYESVVLYLDNRAWITIPDIRASGDEARALRGEHPFGSAETPNAHLALGYGRLTLEHVSLWPYVGWCALRLATYLLVVWSLHRLERILHHAASRKPLSAANARRLRQIGWAAFLLWLISIVQHLVLDAFVEAVSFDGIARLTRTSTSDLPLLLVALLAFTASAVVRYGGELRDEQQLVV